MKGRFIYLITVLLHTPEYFSYTVSRAVSILVEEAMEIQGKPTPILRLLEPFPEIGQETTTRCTHKDHIHDGLLGHCDSLLSLGVKKIQKSRLCQNQKLLTNDYLTITF